MIYYLGQLLVSVFSPLNVLKYITLRSIGAMFTALIIAIFSGKKLITYLSFVQVGGQPIREDGPETHIKKQGTPTMGGILILGSMLIAVMLWSDLSNLYIWVTLFTIISHAALGFIDDYLKVTRRNSRGVSCRMKLIYQFSLSWLAALAVGYITSAPYQNSLAIPFTKNLLLNIGLFYPVFASVVITGTSNAVNLTDGLDGLATIPIVLVAGCLAVICYLSGNSIFAHYLYLPYLPQVGELAVLCSAIIGASLGFLWYNAPPAQIFMGDVGSLALGAAMGIISVICKHEITLIIIGGLFVIEAVSVILQVASFKLRGKRVLLMAPIHHHFEKLGWSESKVVIRFWIISLLFAMLGLATLKIR